MPLTSETPASSHAWRTALSFLFLYRCAMSFVAQTFISQFTSLGDFGDWTSSNFNFGEGWFLDSSPIVANIVALFSRLLFENSILISLAFQTLAFAGITYLLNRLPSSARWRMLPLMFLPSFTLWTSIPSKEAVLVVAVSILCGYLVDLHFGRERLKLIHVAAVYIVWVFKPHYGPALAYFGLVTITARYVRPPAFVALAGGLLSLAPLYLFSTKLNELAFDMVPHFSSAAGSTRDAFWVEVNDVFLKAPIGMIESFFGPTLPEALRGLNLLHTVTFWEGMILMVILAYYMLAHIRWMSAYTLFLSAFFLFWILFANYPFGVMNPGSAVRYRAGYIFFIFIVFCALFSRDGAVLWLQGRPKGQRRAIAPAARLEIHPSPAQ